MQPFPLISLILISSDSEKEKKASGAEYSGGHQSKPMSEAA